MSMFLIIEVQFFFFAKGFKIQKIQKPIMPLVPSFLDNWSHTVYVHQMSLCVCECIWDRPVLSLRE
jgi:hypothetical protein